MKNQFLFNTMFLLIFICLMACQPKQQTASFDSSVMEEERDELLEEVMEIEEIRAEVPIPVEIEEEEENDDWIIVPFEPKPYIKDCEKGNEKNNEKRDCTGKTLLTYIYQHLKTFENVEGLVVVGFVIDKNGKLIGAKIVKGLSPEVDKEVLRVVQMMPFEWEAGRYRNQPTDIRYNVPIRFKAAIATAKEEIEEDIEFESQNFDEEEIIDLEPVEIKEEPISARVVEEEGKAEEIEEEFCAIQNQAYFSLCKDIEDLEERKECTQNKLLKYFYTNLKNPEEKVEGMAVLSFIVDIDSTAHRPKIVKSLSSAADDELLRIFNNMPFKWYPALKRGRLMKVKYNLLIRFRIPKDTFMIEENPDRLDDEVLITPVEKMPYLEDCSHFENTSDRKRCTEEKIMNFINEALHYPNDESAEGVVVVTFLVKRDGQVSDIKVVRGLSELIDKSTSHYSIYAI